MKLEFRHLARSLVPHRHEHRQDARSSELAELRAALCDCLTGSRADFMSEDALRARLREIDQIAAGKVHITGQETW